jgi:DNA mismatch repair ATPase MutS
MTALEMYNKVKPNYPTAILLLGDVNWYYSFREDARIVNEITKQGLENGVCTFSRVGLDSLLPMIVRAGYRVAVIEEIGISRMISPIKRDVLVAKETGAEYAKDYD